MPPPKLCSWLSPRMLLQCIFVLLWTVRGRYDPQHVSYQPEALWQCCALDSLVRRKYANQLNSVEQILVLILIKSYTYEKPLVVVGSGSLFINRKYSLYLCVRVCIFIYKSFTVTVIKPASVVHWKHDCIESGSSWATFCYRFVLQFSGCSAPPDGLRTPEHQMADEDEEVGLVSGFLRQC